MALSSFIYNNRPQRVKLSEKPENSSEYTEVLVVDVTLSDEISYQNELTQHPVEEGLDATDHVRSKPLQIKIDGMLSGSPISLDFDTKGLVTSGASVINQQVGGFKGAAGAATIAGASKYGAKLLGETADPLIQARDKLLELASKKTPMRYVHKLKNYDDMIITSLSFPRDKSIGRALKFSMTLQQINIVKSETTQIEKISRSAAHSAAKKSNLGTQAAKGLNEQKEKRSSILYKLGKGIGGLFGG